MNPTVAMILSQIGKFLISLLGTTAVKKIIVEKLRALARKTDNEVDDHVVALIESALSNKKDIGTLKAIYENWTGKKINGTGDK